MMRIMLTVMCLLMGVNTFNMENATTAIGTSVAAETREYNKVEVTRELESNEVEITQELIQTLPEVPDWNSEDAILDFYKGTKVPQELIEVYNAKAAAGELSNGFLNLVYQGKYVTCILYAEYKEEKYVFYGSGLYRDGDLLVSESVFSRKISRDTYYPDGKVNEEKIYLDFPAGGYNYLFDVVPMSAHTLEVIYGVEDAEMNYYNQGFSVCYDVKNSELVCVRFGKEIGERTAVSPIDINILMKNIDIPNTSIDMGYKIPNGTVIYPVVLQNEKGISFHLLKRKTSEIATLEDLERNADYFVLKNFIFGQIVNDLKDVVY